MHPADWPRVPVLLAMWLATAAIVATMYLRQPLVALALVVPLVATGWFVRRFWTTALTGAATGLAGFGLAYVTGVPGRPPGDTALVGAAAVSALFGVAVGVIGHAGRLIHRLQERTRDLHEAKADLESSSRYLGAVYEGTSIGLIALDEDSTITSWNPGAATIFGYAADTALGKPITFLADHRDRLAPVLHGLGNRTEVAGAEASLLHRRGHRVDVELRLSPLDGGGILAVVDRSREHVMEEAIADQEEKYETLLKNLDDAFYALRADTHALVAVTGGVKQLTGHAPARFQDHTKGWMDLVHPEDRDAVEQTLRHARSGESSCIRWRLRHADGHYIWVEDRLVPTRDAEGRVVRLDGRLRRLDALVESEATLARRQAMLDGLPSVAWFEMDEDGWDWGPGAMRLLDLPKPAMARPGLLLERIHPDDLDAFQQAFDTGQPRDVRIQVGGHRTIATVHGWVQEDPRDGSCIRSGVLEIRARPAPRQAMKSHGRASSRLLAHSPGGQVPASDEADAIGPGSLEGRPGPAGGQPAQRTDAPQDRPVQPPDEDAASAAATEDDADGAGAQAGDPGPGGGDSAWAVDGQRSHGPWALDE